MAKQLYAPTNQMVYNPPWFQKKGITQMIDAEARFSPKVHWERNFELEPAGQDYHVKCDWSIWVPTKEIGLAMEKVWEVVHPKNVWIDKTYNGCTECRFFKLDKWREIIKDHEKRYPSEEYSYKPNYWKVYLMLFTKKDVAPSEILSYI